MVKKYWIIIIDIKCYIRKRMGGDYSSSDIFIREQVVLVTLSFFSSFGHHVTVKARTRWWDMLGDVDWLDYLINYGLNGCWDVDLRLRVVRSLIVLRCCWRLKCGICVRRMLIRSIVILLNLFSLLVSLLFLCFF